MSAPARPPRRMQHAPGSADRPSRLRPDPALGVRPGPERAGLLRRPGRAKPLLGHRRHLPVRLPDHVGRRRAARRAADDRPQHPAGRRRDRIGERREQQGQLPDLFPPPRRPRGRVVAVRQGRHADRARGAGDCCSATTTRPGRRTRRRSQDRRTLEIGGERIDLAWHGANHSPDNIIIHLPDHDTLMLIDIVNPGWAPVYVSQPDRGHPRLRRGVGERARLLVEALHRRPPRAPRHARRR